MVHESLPLHEAPLAIVARYAVQIVEIEGPVHLEEVGRRLSRLWGYKRAGRRIQDAARRAVSVAMRNGDLRYSLPGNGPFLELPEGRAVAVRDRSNVRAATLRKVEMLPPAEVRLAVLQVVERSVGITENDCAVEVARAFGFKATSADMRRYVAENAKLLVSEGRLVVQGSEYRLP